MADVTSGMRGTGNMPPSQRSGGFKHGIKTPGPRVTRKDVEAMRKKGKKRQR